MNHLTVFDLASFERVEPPKVKESNFQLAFSFLPKEERLAINTIYSLFSYIDYIVDEGGVDQKSTLQKDKRLKFWLAVVDELYNDSIPSPIFYPLYFAIKRFSLPKQYIVTLIDGCRRDLFQKRYKTFQELKDYCYSVASVVGLITIEIFGYKYAETRNYAINLGYALQLTNILRDVKKDKDRGYIYIPLEDLQNFDYSEEDLINEVYNDHFVELMEFETKRTREFFHKARSLLHPDERITLFPAEVMDEIYFRLLEKIELSKFRVFDKEIKVSKIHKLAITLKHWLSILLFIKPFAK
ncbi:MAG: Phytoene synthase [Candidatus Kapaibacterium sp.]|jgi:phytoene synthase|nr:MAG: Phytoene synthase [Candidatus Kapabacteria bacterium]ROL56600.1 MAG: squalene synthase HpnD [Bacteroidetes/Chlorobi group bacterium Naka2016]